MAGRKKVDIEEEENKYGRMWSREEEKNSKQGKER